MQKDKDEVHIVYYIRTSREAEDGYFDGGEIKVHQKHAADALVKLFQELGFKVTLDRVSEHRLIDEIENKDDDCEEDDP